MCKLNNEVRILRLLEEHHRLFFDKFPSENRHWNASWLQIIFLGANLFRFRETQTSKLRMEDRGKLIPAKFNGIRETFNATKRSNRVRSSSSIIKKDADSDFNDYLLTFFSLFLFQIYIEFTELRNWLYARQTKIAKRTCSKLHEKKRKKKKKLRIPSVSCSTSILAICTKMVSMRSNYSSRGQLAASGAKNLNNPSSVALNCCGRLAPVLHPSSRHPKIYLRPRGPARIRYDAGQAEKIISPRKLKLLWEPSQQRKATRINIWSRVFWRYVYILQ